MIERSSHAETPPGGPARWLLVLGIACVFFTFIRFTINGLGWIAFAPSLVYAYRARSAKHWLLLLASLIVGFILAVSKMATSEIPWAPVPAFAVPMAVSYFVAVALAAFVRRRANGAWAAYTFASAVTVLGWIQYTFTPGGSWGVLAFTQLDNLPLLQLAALTGLGGITWLVAVGSGLAAGAWCDGERAMRHHVVVFVLLVGAATIHGSLRLGRAAPGEPVRIASVVSPVTPREFYAAMRGVDTLRTLDDALFARSARAVALGAKIVVWNEVATVVTLAGEEALAERGGEFAHRYGVMLVMAYGVAERMRPFHYINKYRIYMPEGRREDPPTGALSEDRSLADDYRKRHPVPADPNTPSAAHAKVVPFGNALYSGAICYDYDFPAIARDNARDGADVALVPSSDWRGIDPEHARMAIVNALAVGLPLVRPVRAATSVVSDQFGRVIGTMRFDGATDGVMVTAVPAARVRTLYARTGEVVPLIALAFCTAAMLRSTRTTTARARMDV